LVVPPHSYEMDWTEIPPPIRSAFFGFPTPSFACEQRKKDRRGRVLTQGSLGVTPRFSVSLPCALW